MVRFLWLGAKGFSANPKANSESTIGWFLIFSFTIYFNLIRLMLLGLGVISYVLYILLPCLKVFDTFEA